MGRRRRPAEDLKLFVGLGRSRIIALGAPANAPGNLVDHGDSPALLHDTLKATFEHALGAASDA
jgi:hypothetical protein